MPLSFLLLIFLILIINLPIPSNKSEDLSIERNPKILSEKNQKVSYEIGTKTVNLGYSLTTHFSLLNYFNVFYHWIMYLVLVASNYLYRYIDKGFLEFFGPLGLLRFINYSGFLVEIISTGYIPHYAFIKIKSIKLFKIGWFVI